ncbi:MAG: hypothetical protein KBC35_01595 [Candidatus Pacebacteria bacterium]|nr:hypothetical protein [Candidatus Paceibacterota bacterium]
MPEHEVSVKSTHLTLPTGGRYGSLEKKMSSVKKIIGTFDGENENGTTVSRFLWTGETGGEKFSLVTFGPPVVGSKRGEDSSVLQVGKYKLQLACGGCCTPLSSILDIFEEVRVCGGRLHFTCVEQKLYQMGMEIPTWLYQVTPLDGPKPALEKELARKSEQVLYKILTDLGYNP